MELGQAMMQAVRRWRNLPADPGKRARGGRLRDPAHLHAGGAQPDGTAADDRRPEAASAERITAVLPYYGYARQDRKDKPRVPISARLVAALLETAGADRVLTLDLHAAQIQGFFDIPVDHLFAAPVMIEYFKPLNIPDMTVVSPDAGGVERARAFAKRLNAPLAIIDKRREEANVAEVMNVVGEVRGRHCLLVDDLIDTAGTLVKGAEALLEKGAASVSACATHAVLSGPAVERIEASVFEGSGVYEFDSALGSGEGNRAGSNRCRSRI